MTYDHPIIFNANQWLLRLARILSQHVCRDNQVNAVIVYSAWSLIHNPSYINIILIVTLHQPEQISLRLSCILCGCWLCNIHGKVITDLEL